MPEFIPKQYKTILNKLKYIDHWFWGRYTLNPYNGCQFGCIYCDARSAKYHMPEDFETRILVKEGAAGMLDRRISNARTLLPDVVCLGGVTDCYQPAEKVYENTRQCLEVLLKHRYPVHIVTKSTLVLRDLDLLEEIGRRTWCTVSVTITTPDPAVAKFLDKFSPSPQKRFDVVRRIKLETKNVNSGILLIPLIPYLADSESTLEQMVAMSAATGADYMLFGGGMTLRDKQATWFLLHLKESYPDLIEQFQHLYRFNDIENYDGRYEPAWNYLVPKHKKLFDCCRRYNLPWRIQRFVPDDWRSINYRVAGVLLNEAYKLHMLGRHYQQLFWAGQNIQMLRSPLQDLIAQGRLQEIRNIDGRIETRIRLLVEELSS